MTDTLYNADGTATVEHFNAKGDIDGTVNLATFAAGLIKKVGSDSITKLLDDLGFRSPRNEATLARRWDGWAFDPKVGARRPTAEVTRCSYGIGWESVGTVNEHGWKVGGWSVRVIMDPVDKATKDARLKVQERSLGRLNGQSPQAIVAVAWEESASPREIQERRNGIPQYQRLPNGERVAKMTYDLDKKGRPWVDHIFTCFMHRLIVAPSAEAAYEAALVMAEEVGRAIQEHYDERTGYNARPDGEDVVVDQGDDEDEGDWMSEL